MVPVLDFGVDAEFVAHTVCAKIHQPVASPVLLGKSGERQEEEKHQEFLVQDFDWLYLNPGFPG